MRLVRYDVYFVETKISYVIDWLEKHLTYMPNLTEQIFVRRHTEFLVCLPSTDGELYNTTTSDSDSFHYSVISASKLEKKSNNIYCIH